MLVNCWSPALTSDHTPVMVRDHEGSWVRSEDWCARVRECQDLRDRLATARNDALEEAAKVAECYHEAAIKWAATYVKQFDGETDSKRIAAAIRTLKTEPT